MFLAFREDISWKLWGFVASFSGVKSNSPENIFTKTKQQMSHNPKLKHEKNELWGFVARYPGNCGVLWLDIPEIVGFCG